MKKAFVKSLAMTVVLMFSTEAQADIVCRGKPTSVVVDRYSFVATDFGFGYIYLCNLDFDVTAPYSAMKSACAALLSQAMTAAASGKEIGLHFTGLTSCSGIRASSGWAVQQPGQMYFFP